MDEIVAVAIKKWQNKWGEEIAPTPHSELPQVQKTKKILHYRVPAQTFVLEHFFCQILWKKGP